MIYVIKKMLLESRTIPFTVAMLFADFKKLLSISHNNSGSIKGWHGGIYPHQRLCPTPLLAPQSEEKNGQNQPFSAKFWIFAPSEMHFATSMPHKTISGAAAA